MSKLYGAGEKLPLLSALTSLFISAKVHFAHLGLDMRPALAFPDRMYFTGACVLLNIPGTKPTRYAQRCNAHTNARTSFSLEVEACSTGARVWDAGWEHPVELVTSVSFARLGITFLALKLPLDRKPVADIAAPS